jgi:hypothetical protein
MVEQKAYQAERAKLVSLLNDAIGVSPSVEQFLNQEETPSKFHVDAGIVELDDSLTPLGGKEL